MSFVEIKTDKGHDAFLLDEPEMFDTVRGFLNAVAAAEGWHERRARICAPDLAAIAEMIPDGARVLDVGCGDGALLEHLVRTKKVDGRGIELSQQNVNACVARGLAVVQGDADTDLAEYPGQVFDFVILSQTIQATEKPAQVLEHLLRIGRQAAISLPNFGHWRVRLSLLLARAHAAHQGAGLSLVRHAQHPSLHLGRFRRSGADAVAR